MTGLFSKVVDARMELAFVVVARADVPASVLESFVETVDCLEVMLVNAEQV